MEEEPAEPAPKKQGWLIAGIVTSIFFALFWSADTSFRYVLGGIATFCFYQYLKTNRVTHSPPSYQSPSQENSPVGTDTFLQDVKEIFEQASSPNVDPQAKQKRALILVVSGFIFSILFLITILSLFSGGDSYSSAEWYLRATEYYNAQEYDSASYYYRLALREDPENPVLYLERGNAFYNLNRNDSALILYTQALELDPKYEEAQYNVGLVHYNQKSYRQAIEDVRKIMIYNPGNTDAMVLLGDCYYSQNELDSAFRWYDGAYTNGYRSAGLCHVMGYICDSKGQTDRAIRLYMEAVKQDSTRIDVYLRLGELLPGEEGNYFRAKATGSAW